MEDNILRVKDYKTLIHLPNHSSGEIAYCEDEKEYYMYEDDEWKNYKLELNSDGIQIDLYELNKQTIEKQFPPYTEKEWNEAKRILEDWYTNDKHDYYMLYGKKISYFTLFNRKNTIGEFTCFYNALKECLTDLGAVRSFEVIDERKAIEIWVEYENDLTCLLLFNYDKGVVTFNG